MADLKGSIWNFTRSVTKASGDLFKTTKLSVTLAGEQEALKNLYVEIGKKVHEIYQFGGSLGKVFDERVAEIIACEERIKDLQNRIGEIKGTRECPKCGKTVERGSEFCPRCGHNMTGGARMADEPNAERGGAVPPLEPSPAVPAFGPTPVGEPSAPMDAAPFDAAPPNATAPAAPGVPASMRLCAVCGTHNEPSAKFCLNCGRILS